MDGRRTKTDHKSSPCHYVTGELKMLTLSVKTRVDPDQLASNEAS